MQTTIFKRSKRNKNFTIINNEILTNKSMSFEARGILCFILSLPDNWVFNKTWLMAEYNIGRSYTDRCFGEIEAAGYMASFDFIRDQGKFTGKGYIFYDESICTKSADAVADLPTAVEPQAANQHLISTNSIQSTNINKYTYNQFYDSELSKSNQDENYNKFINVLFGANPLGKPLSAVLKMQEQLSWHQFPYLWKIKTETGCKITDVLLAMENWKDLHKRKTVLETFRTFASPKK